ncbi:hypothetical protein [Parasphingorhabdus sp.]|uniref:hypothetical protein n=1 Tax=Parasphingorhabdus sp. TaxID=2709688 RepID=UPI002F9410F8
MSDLYLEQNLHDGFVKDGPSGSDADVAPLWRMPVEQKEFSAWFGNLSADAGPAAGHQFQSFDKPAAAPAPAMPAEDLEPDIFEVAYRKGWEDGQAALAEEQAADNQAAIVLADAIRHVNDLYSTGSFSLILNAIESLFRRCSELAMPDPLLLEAWAVQLADRIDQDQKGASLILHPDDLKLIDQNLCKLPLRADPTLLRGNLKLSHAGGWIERGSETVLEELRALIDEFSSEQSENPGQQP